jgi:uncharacterized RDD family membrane protein YckC
VSDEQPINSEVIAGFWRRLGAFSIDCLILGALGLALGTIFGSAFVKMGPWGRLMGFAIALAYFGSLNSKLTEGQTPGKRTLKIKVVDSGGAALAPSKAFVRFVPLGTPWFLNGAQFPESALTKFWIFPISFAIFGVGLSLLYLYIFNRATRRSLHDLLVGSYVVRAETQGNIVVPRLWLPHLLVCGVLCVAAALVPYFTAPLAASEPFASLLQVQRAVVAEPWVLSAQVQVGKTYAASSSTGKTQTKYLNVSAYSSDDDIANKDRAKHLAKLSLVADSSTEPVDVVNVGLIYGYDIGIASAWKSYNHSYSPQELHEQ